MADKKKSIRKRTEGETIQLGLATHELASVHRTRIEARLPPGMLESLLAKVSLLRHSVPAAIGAVAEKGASTVTQNVAAEHAHGIVMAIRDALIGSRMDGDTKKEWGVGTRVRAESVPQVVAAGQQILARAATHPDEAVSAGVLPRDLAGLRAALDRLGSADVTSDGKKISTKNVIAQRNAAGRAIEEAAARISALGRLEFLQEPQIAERFAALTARSGGDGPAET